MMQPARIRHSRTLIHRQPANFLFYKVFTQENATSFLRKSSSPFSLQELRPLTPLKATDRFTSLTVIGMMKIMCNRCVKDSNLNIATRHTMWIYATVQTEYTPTQLESMRKYSGSSSPPLYSTNLTM
jgi:hypothetical protein